MALYMKRLIADVQRANKADDEVLLYRNLMALKDIEV